MGIIFGKKKLGKSIDRLKRTLFVLFLISAIRTISRGVFVGIGLQIILLIRFFRPQRKRWLGWVLGLGIIGVIAVSALKPASTVAHLSAWTEGRSAFAQQPLGHGLGSAGPAIHREGVYLPENHYLQLLLDI